MQKTAIGLFFACLLVYHANGRALPEVDCMDVPYTAWSLIRHGSFDLRFYPELKRLVGFEIRELADGSWISMRPPGIAFAAVPFVLPFAIAQESPLRFRDMQKIGKAAAAFSVAVASVFFFLICRRLAPDAAWPATILFAFGTCLWSVASQALWAHGPATFWLCCGFHILSRADDHSEFWHVASGLALGFAVLTRPTTALFALATCGALLTQGKWRAAAWLTLGGVVPVVFLCLVNWTYFGDPVLGPYPSRGLSNSPPLWLGLGGLLIAPSRGVLVYSPALLFVLPGVIRLVRQPDAQWNYLRPMLLAWLLAAGATLFLYARWIAWWGGWSYGPRFLCETMPILCLLFAIGYHCSSRWKRSVAKGLVAVSIAVHLLGIFGYGGYHAWQQRHDLRDQGRSMFDLSDTQIEAHSRALLSRLMALGGPR